MTARYTVMDVGDGCHTIYDRFKLMFVKVYHDKDKCVAMCVHLNALDDAS